MLSFTVTSGLNQKSSIYIHMCLVGCCCSWHQSIYSHDTEKERFCCGRRIQNHIFRIRLKQTSQSRTNTPRQRTFVPKFKLQKCTTEEGCCYCQTHTFFDQWGVPVGICYQFAASKLVCRLFGLQHNWSNGERPNSKKVEGSVSPLCVAELGVNKLISLPGCILFLSCDKDRSLRKCPSGALTVECKPTECLLTSLSHQGPLHHNKSADTHSVRFSPAFDKNSLTKLLCFQSHKLHTMGAIRETHLQLEDCISIWDLTR